MASNPQLHDILTDLSELDDELLSLGEVTGEAPIARPASRAYRHAAEKVRAVIEKHRAEPEFEWGIKYRYHFNDGEDIYETWGYSSDPRLPRIVDNGREIGPSITPEGTIYVGDDEFEVVAVSKRVKATPEEWEPYTA